MADASLILARMMQKFERRAALTESDKEALLSLPFRERTVEPHQYIVREGMEVTESCLLLSGLAYRQKVTETGARQILSIHMTGDFVDLEGSLLRRADHSIQALTRCMVAMVPVCAIISLIDERPRVGRAMWVDTLIDGSIFREWIVNVGQRDARARLAHLLCEYARRAEVAGLSDGESFELPMSQEQLGDCTGLTTVHVNRTLKAMEKDKLIERSKRFVRVPNWEQLRRVAGFSELYLHLDQAT